MENIKLLIFRATALPYIKPNILSSQFWWDQKNIDQKKYKKYLTRFFEFGNKSIERLLYSAKLLSSRIGEFRC